MNGSCHLQNTPSLGSRRGKPLDRGYRPEALLAYPSRDLRAIVPPDVTENVCAKHKGAIIDRAQYSL